MTEVCKREIADVVGEVIRLVIEGDRCWYENEDGRYGTREQDAKYNVDLARCIFGSLVFRPVAISPTWRTSTVLAIAQNADENRNLPSGESFPARLAVWVNDPGTIHQWGHPSGRLDPVYLAVLADALEDAGCTNVDILNHLRGPGPHVKGCWCVDLFVRRVAVNDAQN